MLDNRKFSMKRVIWAPGLMLALMMASSLSAAQADDFTVVRVSHKPSKHRLISVRPDLTGTIETVEPAPRGYFAKVFGTNEPSETDFDFMTEKPFYEAY